MVEEVKLNDETKQELGNASIKRIEQIKNLVKEYFRAIYGSLNSDEFLAIGLDTVFSGMQLISRSNDMDLADVDSRIATMKMIQNTINQMFEKVYLNPEVVAQMVAKASMESLERQGLAKNLKKKEDK